MNRLSSMWASIRRITKINLIIGTALSLIVAYLATTVYFGAASQVRYDSNDFPGAKKAASVFLVLSPFQRHIGYFNRGTAEAAVGDYDVAQADLEDALRLAPPAAECAVRINLSYVYEKQADEVAGQDPGQSKELYDQALKTLEDAPDECRPDKSEEKQKSDTAKKRVEDKKKGEEAKENGADDDGSQEKDSSGDEESQDSGGEEDRGAEEQKPDDPGKSEQEKKREELKKRGEDSERQQQQQRPGGEGGRTTPEKPW